MSQPSAIVRATLKRRHLDQKLLEKYALRQSQRMKIQRCRNCNRPIRADRTLCQKCLNIDGGRP